MHGFDWGFFDGADVHDDLPRFERWSNRFRNFFNSVDRNTKEDLVGARHCLCKIGGCGNRELFFQLSYFLCFAIGKNYAVAFLLEKLGEPNAHFSSADHRNLHLALPRRFCSTRLRFGRLVRLS